METFPDGMTVGELRRVLATWAADAEVWIGDGAGNLYPARMVATMGPDSTGLGDAVYLDIRGP